MNPYHYAAFHESAGYEVFAKEKLKSLKGIIVVRKDSPIRSLEELDGKTLAFPDPVAFAASIITQAELANRGLKVQAKYVSSHDSVYQSVEKGIYPAGGGVPRTFNSTAEVIRAQLRILWTSAGFTPHAIAAHPRVPKEAIDRVKEALFSLAGDPQGKDVLKNLEMKDFESVANSQYDDVRALRIKTLQH
jgi:phosphonate transport system substrate-binding protein